MDDKSIIEILHSGSVDHIKTNLNTRIDFLDLIKKIDSLPEMKRCSYEEIRCLYQAISNGRDIDTVEKQFEDFFGAPIRPAAKFIPKKLHLESSIKYLGSIPKEQTLFIKEIESGTYYGALCPWVANIKNIAVHLGFCSNKMSDKEYNNFHELVKTKALYESILEEKDAVASGHVYGMSVASFLLMAMLAETTCTLKTQTNGNTGYLYLSRGDLIAAETGELKNREAAYEITSWDKTVIEIENASSKKGNEINQPLMQILIEGLKMRGKNKVLVEKLIQRANRVKKRRFVTISALAFATLLILAISTAVLLSVIKSKRIKGEYQSLLVQVENIQDLEEKGGILQNFVDSHSNSTCGMDAQKKIEEIRNRIEERDFDTTIRNAKMLPKDNNYEKEAKAIYIQYLTKYPDGLHAVEIKRKISDLMDDMDYEKLKDVAKSDYDERIRAYETYLAAYPKGKHRDKVQELISDTIEEYHDFLTREIVVCDRQEKWEHCIQLCNEFLATLGHNRPSGEVVRLRKEMQEKRDLTVLMAKLENADYAVAKRKCLKYLEMNPDSSQKDKIRNEIAKIDKKLQKKREWETIVAYRRDQQRDVSGRIKEVRKYVAQNPSGQYVEDAKKILKRLQTEKQARMEREKEKIRAQLKQSGGQFIENGDGTISDTETGLMWCMLDYSAEQGKCLDYESAVKYVRGLKTGGYRDWRLPTANELARIYKSEPYFPSSGAKWYWTCETFWQAWNKYAYIVTPKRERFFKRESTKLGQCGCVRAVRP